MSAPAMGATQLSYETTVRSSAPARVGGSVTPAPLTPTGNASPSNGNASPSKPSPWPESEDDGYRYLTLLRWMVRNAADEERRVANALPPGPHGADEFVYLARLDRDPNDWQPYALGVREYHGVDRTDYYTMSAQGITHFLDGVQPEFITAERWELEVANYKKIKSLTVFRTYKKWKSWKLWRKSVMSAKMQRAASVLEKNLFVLDPVFAPTIDKVRDACRELSEKRLSKVRTGEVRTLGAFVDEVKEAREEMTEEFARFSAEQTATVSDACQRSLDAMEARLEEFYGDDLDRKSVV